MIDYDNSTRETKLIVYYVIKLNNLRIILRRTLDIYSLLSIIIES
jgi:hypothetical protein